MFGFILICIISLFLYDKYVIKKNQKQREFEEENPHKEFKETTEEKFERAHEIAEDIGFKKIDDLKKAKKDLRDFKKTIPIFIVMGLFFMPISFLLIPLWIGFKYFIYNTRVETLEEEMRKEKYNE